MNLSQTKHNELIERDIHCPYCEKDHALMYSRTISKSVSIQYPAYGLRFILSFIYLSALHIFINGYKLIEFAIKYNDITYAFCPECGSTYSLEAPEEIKEEAESPKLYRIREGQKVMGICKGISEYTGISLLWIRFITLIYCFSVIGLLFYFFLSFCIGYKEDEDKDIVRPKLYRIRNGRDVKGLCLGISRSTDIPVGWVRFIMLMLIVMTLIPYFVACAFIPYKEDIDNGFTRLPLYKVKRKKLIFGLCAGLSERSGRHRFVYRLIFIIFFPLYFIIAPFVPTEVIENV